jgi:hypothetical protein
MSLSAPSITAFGEFGRRSPGRVAVAADGGAGRAVGDHGAETVVARGRLEQHFAAERDPESGERDREHDERSDRQCTGGPAGAAQQPVRLRRLARAAQGEDRGGEQREAAEHRDHAARLGPSRPAGHEAKTVGDPNEAAGHQTEHSAPGDPRAAAHARVEQDRHSRQRDRDQDTGERGRRPAQRGVQPMQRERSNASAIERALRGPGAYRRVGRGGACARDSSLTRVALMFGFPRRTGGTSMIRPSNGARLGASKQPLVR